MRAKTAEPRALSGISDREVKDFCELVTFDHEFFSDAFGRPGCHEKYYGLVVKDRATKLVMTYPSHNMMGESVIAQLNYFKNKTKI